jgi:hypothetical protein
MIHRWRFQHRRGGTLDGGSTALQPDSAMPIGHKVLVLAGLRALTLTRSNYSGRWSSPGYATSP